MRRAALLALLDSDPNLIDPSAWIMTVGAGGSATNSPQGQLNLVGVGVASSADVQLPPVVPGGTYALFASVGTGNVSVRVGSSQGASALLNATAPVGDYLGEFTPTGAVAWIRFSKTTGTSIITNITCRRKR